MKLSITLLLLLACVNLIAQPIDCAPILDFRHPDPSFTRSEHSQSVQGFTGEKYEFLVPVEPGEQYRFTFFVSAILTREIHFKIEDVKSGQVLLDLPGTTKENKRNECVLATYFDELYNKTRYPFFDFNPKATTTYKVTVNIAKYKRPKPQYVAEDAEYFEEEVVIKKEKKQSAYIQQRKACY